MRDWLVHGADCLGTECRDGVVDRALEPRQTVPFGTDAHLRADGDIVEHDVPGAAAVDGGIVAAIDARLRLADDEQADTAAIAPAAGGPRRDDQAVGPGRADHHLFAAVQPVSITVPFRAQRDIVKIVPALCLGQASAQRSLPSMMRGRKV